MATILRNGFADVAQQVTLSRLWLSSALILIASHANAETVGQTNSLTEIAARAMTSARLLRSLEFDATLTRQGENSTNITASRDGQFYRIERHDVGTRRLGKSTIPAQNVAVAFDGSRYQRLNGTTGEMFLASSPGPPVIQDICLVPFGWLTYGTGEPPSWELLRSTTHWDKRFSSAVFVKEEHWAEFVCEVVDFPHLLSKTAAHYRVYFARDYGMYPVRYVRSIDESGELASECKVIEIKKFDADGLMGIMPTSIDYRQTDVGRGTPMSWSLRALPSSIKINQSIDPKTFTLSTLRAVKTYDKVAFPVSATGAAILGGSTLTSRYTLVALNIAVILVLFSWILMRRRRRGLAPTDRM